MARSLPQRGTLFLLLVGLVVPSVRADERLFREQVAPLLEQHCVRCHGEKAKRGRLFLHQAKGLFAGGESGPVVVPGKPDESLLVQQVTGAKPKMPRNAPPLTEKQVAVLRRWIEAGAVWPMGLTLRERGSEETWWSLRPLTRPTVPPTSTSEGLRSPIDRFVRARLEKEGLTPSPEADRRTLLRRLSFDLLGLPPSPEEVEAFVADERPDAYERVVDRLLASPHFGERWGRHWLDVVHYGDTHGYDKDKLRPNAWPYRDFVIRSFNDDKPYDRFVKEQIAGDVLFPGTADGIVALGFLAAGPWDFVGQVELREGTLDKHITRNLDRDDMVATTWNTFVSLTVQCARCHDHKFDPLSQQEYYSLQANFAAIDRADRPISPGAAPFVERPEFGYHSAIEPRQDVVKWVQVDLGQPTRIDTIRIVGCHDTFNNIGAGFGFPVRYRIEASDDPKFATSVVVQDRTGADVPNPGVQPQTTSSVGKTARYVRVTATRLAPRKDDFIFALAELSVMTPEGRNVARGAVVTALDSIEAPVRWRKQNLVDGYSYRGSAPQSLVFAAATHFAPSGNFTPTNGKPRPIALLKRGSEKNPGPLVEPGAIACVVSLPATFDLPEGHTEGERRASLARWITDTRNPLTWRSLVNRLWHYHMGRGLVETLNDFGRMGSLPSHSELLDWLAVELREGGQSLKTLHRQVVTSAVYRQRSSHDDANARIDSSNRFLWRMNRRRLEAEAVRDTVLAVSGRLDQRMGGPGFRPFGFKDDHSPHYKYEEYDPDDPASLRRSVYRFLVRSVPDPFMETLDCADPSLLVERRNETLTALQALALLNNRTMVRMASHLAGRVKGEAATLRGQLTRAYQLTLGRLPTLTEMAVLVEHSERHGLASTCRLILNTNEFSFTD